MLDYEMNEMLENDELHGEDLEMVLGVMSMVESENSDLNSDWY